MDLDNLKEIISEMSMRRLNCSQIMMQLSLELRGKENPELIRSLRGLGSGLQTMHVCGILTGGCCVLSSYEDAERIQTSGSIFLPSMEMVKSYVGWFEKRFGSLLCTELLDGDRSKIRDFCPALIEECFEKCIEILQENGIDPTM